MAIIDIIEKLERDTEIKAKNIRKASDEKIAKLTEDCNNELKRMEEENENIITSDEKIAKKKYTLKMDSIKSSILMNEKSKLLKEISLDFISEFLKDKKNYVSVLSYFISKIDFNKGDIFYSSGKYDETKEVLDTLKEKDFSLKDETKEVELGFVFGNETGVKIYGDLKNLLQEEFFKKKEFEVLNILFGSN